MIRGSLNIKRGFSDWLTIHANIPLSLIRILINIIQDNAYPYYPVGALEDIFVSHSWVVY